jgi:hypothetical protein
VEDDDAKEARCDHEGERSILNQRFEAGRGVPRRFWWAERHAKSDWHRRELLRQEGTTMDLCSQRNVCDICSRIVQYVISRAGKTPSVPVTN